MSDHGFLYTAKLVGIVMTAGIMYTEYECEQKFNYAKNIYFCYNAIQYILPTVTLVAIIWIIMSRKGFELN